MFDLLVHIYYEESWHSYLRNTINNLQSFQCNFFINICCETEYYHQLAKIIKKDCPKAFILSSPNIGKDIGGKLLLIDFWMQTNLQAPLLVIIHDKRSPHTITGEQWRKKLYKIVDPENIKFILKLFDKESTTGLIGSREFLIDEYNVKQRIGNSNNLAELTKLQSQYNIYPKNHKFIAGTMFWIRSSIIKKFFANHPPLDCRKLLEGGNVQDMVNGTKTHSWERLICWIVSDQGYKLKGI